MVTVGCPAGAPLQTPCALQVSQSDDGGRQSHPAAAQPPVAARSGATLPEPAQGQSWLVRTGVGTAYVVGPPAALTASGVPHDAPLAWTGNEGRTWSRQQILCAIPALSVALSAAPDGALVAVRASQPAAGYQPKSVAVSTDGGRTWAQRGPCRPGGCASSPLTGGYLGTVDALSATKAFAIGPRSQLDETTDGGATWTGRSNPGDTAAAHGAARDRALELHRTAALQADVTMTTASDPLASLADQVVHLVRAAPRTPSSCADCAASSWPPGTTTSRSPSTFRSS